MTLHLVVGAATDVGRVRGHNEDAFLVDDQLGLVAVADGMGGHQAGEVASAIALEALRAAVTSGVGIRDAVTTANDAVYEKSTTDDRLRGMGTTLTAGTLAAGGTLLLGHVGDSRAYVLRDHELSRLTTDHSLVEELVQAGELTEAQAEADPRRSMITRVLGIEPSVDVDLYPVQVATGDRLVLCSDGLTGMVSEDHIRDILVGEADPNAAAHRLIEAANTAGGVDNITVLVVDLVDDESPTAAVPAVSPPEPAPATPEPSTRAAARPGSGSRHLWRILRWALPVVVVLGIGFGVVDWYDHHTYFVGTNLGNVAVFQGRPGGLLFWSPTLVGHRTTLLASSLAPEDRRAVTTGHGQFSSVSVANVYIRGLRQRASQHSHANATAPTAPTTVSPAGAPPTP